ncbi:MAG: methylenetetrahydrofolate reductase C-terminal domain-containing protein [Chloroflexi bacterium]|nr:methylenetetrahydrofolate reductase C-terminal domain-containing protein [Chloroflexota bacterium]
MIIAQQKPLEEIKGLLANYQSVLIAGCGTCVTVCFAGGEKEVGILASSLRMAFQVDGDPKDIREATVQRQCEWEYIEAIAEQVQQVDVVLSLACGIGVQTMAERFRGKRLLPGLNTAFLGYPVEQGVWKENCAACGNCVLDKTGGICPIARCSKSLLNGPCGGSHEGKCEISDDVECAWDQIYQRLKELGLLDNMLEIMPAKDWSTGRAGGPKRIVREDLRPLSRGAGEQGSKGAP